MQLTRTLAIALIASVAGFSSVDAQSLRQSGSPAETPPASFEGRQFVDSRGCVFIRAGVDGAVNWVPRVARDRRMICGFKPTFSKAQSASLKAAPKPQVVRITPAEPVAAPEPVKVTKPAVPTVAPASAPVQVAQAQPVQPAAQPIKVTKTRRVTKVQKTVAAQAKTKAVSAPSCPSLSGVSQQYMSHPSAKVRCGSQTAQSNAVLGTKVVASGAAPVTMTPQTKVIQRRVGAKPRRVVAQAETRPVVHKPQVGQVVTEGQVSPNARILPRHVYEQRGHTLNVSTPPKGYKTVWSDGRLNPRRAEGTFAGKAQMEQIWWYNVPRNPKRITAKEAAPQVETATAVRTTVSSKGQLPQKTMQLGGNRFVQVAAYETSKSAQKVARRVKSLGLPVRVGKVTRNGQTYRLVLAGPFADAGSANAALRKAQGAGYGNARLR